MKAARVPRIDALRGLAVFGIMVVNIWGFVYGYGMLTFPAEGGTLALPDAAAIFFAAAFGEQKFYPIFSFLFGAGFALQTGRARGPGPERSAIEDMYRRRLGWLLACGLLHAMLLWFGDILVAYALTGYWLAAKVGQRLSQLVHSLKVLLGVNLGLLAISGALYWFDTTVTQEQGVEHIQQLYRSHATYTQGGWREVARERLLDYLANAVSYVLVLPRLALLFMCGVLATRLGWLTRPHRHRALWRRILLLALCFGIPLNLWWGFMSVDLALNPFSVSVENALGTTIMEVAGPLMAAGYVALFMLAGPKVAGFLEPVGRMALTNYLMQSLFLMLLLQGVGLGLGAHLSRAELMGVAAALMLAQLAFSHWWLARHQQGPMEALWRRHTYRTPVKP